ncbi:MAG TPA: adenosylcobinamide-GDP ribazoletransferase [Streptosporangiaceae bacterium]|nr:adenosylcobinamide-GDP ribazoletransferase [Streptosporangiaceae bacterium]
MYWAGARLAVTLLTVIPLPALRRATAPRHATAPRPATAPRAAIKARAAAEIGQAGDIGRAAEDGQPAGLAVPTRRDATWAMSLAPVVGLLLGAAAAGVLWLATRPGQTGNLLGAVLAIAALAVLTGGLHLDGLADLADGLGSRRPAGGALEIMKRSDIGPFGVVALALTLLVQVTALARAESAGRGLVAIAAAALAGRLAMTAACRSGVPAARGSGLGALVAGSVRPVVAAGLIAAALAAAAAFGWIFVIAIAAGVLAGTGIAALAVRRLGGITGDVLGAIAEVSTAVCLLVTALR